MKRQGNAAAAGLAGAIYGGICGALIGASIQAAQATIIGLVLGALYMGAVEAITDARRKPGELKPLLHRVISATLLGAAAGAVLDSLVSPVVAGLLLGVMVGLFGFGPRKLVTGIVVGLALGVIAAALEPVDGALLGGSIMLVYRLLLAVLFKDTEPIQVAGERIAPDEARYVVPFEAHTGYIGTEYMQTLARETDGTFKRNQPGIGLVDTLDSLRGPHFDPAQIDPRIRHFYEHTSQYKLAIEPAWNPLMRPFFGLFKRSIARSIGQANLPFDIEEAQRGVVSYIDTIDYPGDTPEHIRTLRGWIRAFEATGEAIYVGIYTVVRHDDIGYISVGFPLPESNFTATLLPYNQGDSLLLKTQDTGLGFPGHYLSDIDNDTGALTILKLPTFGETIYVYVQDDRLKTNHSFYLGGFRFLTLFYTIDPTPEPQT